jgi:cysteinyl-tRNA synthetase
MKIYNSYSGQLEPFVPRHENKVSMYVCGPTVYNYIHIGNARPVVFFDTVRRYFEAKGYEVRFASNFTDVDDKIIQKAKETNQTALEVAEHYIQAFLSDVKKLRSYSDYIQPRVTEYMHHIIDYIAELIRLGYAYEIDGDVYFRVEKIADYGHLSNRKVDELLSGARIEVSAKKESPLDFTLWKKTDDGIQWDSPFSAGRPGWHTECVAMIDDIFGEEIDIHGGGVDIIFPHHENEIAQSIACHGHTVAKYWMHNGRLNIDGAKMSKSEGRMVLVKDLTVDTRGFRLFLLSTHYRSPINYSDDGLDVYVKEWAKIEKTVQSLFRKLDLADALDELVSVVEPSLQSYLRDFDEAMDQDFNTPNAITVLSSQIKAANTLLRQPLNAALFNQTLAALRRNLSIFGLEADVVRLTQEDRLLYREWDAARAAKDFERADFYRQELAKRNLL